MLLVNLSMQLNKYIKSFYLTTKNYKVTQNYKQEANDSDSRLYVHKMQGVLV